MLSPDARRLLAALALACLPAMPTGCGFTPLYATATDGGPAAADQLADVEIGIIPDRDGQVLRNFLIERLNPRGRNTAGRYQLAVAIIERQQELGIEKDATATRANMIIIANFELTQTGAELPLTRQRVASITSFNILDDQFATLSAEQDARRRALRQISDDIRTQLALYFARETAAVP
jgi:LPS-assembly lipoprotein